MRNPAIDAFFAEAERTGLLHQQVFTHVDYDTTPPTVRHFNADAINAEVDASPTLVPITEMRITKEIYQHVMSNRGVEEWKIQRLCAPYLYRPVLMCEIEGHHLSVDGNHRIARLYRDGLRIARAFVVPPSIWEKHLVIMPSAVTEFLMKELA